MSSIDVGLDLQYNSDDDFEAASNDDWSGKTCLIILIDATSPMFSEWESNSETPFEAAIKCCEAMWRTKVMSAPKDRVSLILFGTQQSQNSLNLDNLYELQELSTVKVDMITQLIKMSSSNYINDEFASEIGSCDTYSLKDLFWLVKMNLDSGKTQDFYKRIMLFTCEDDPHSGNPALQDDAVNKFKDLGNVGFSIVTFKEHFDKSKFYDKIMAETSALTYAADLDSIKNIIRVKQRLRRPISRQPLEFGPGVKISVEIHSFVRPAKRPKWVSISKRTNEPVQKEDTAFRKDSGVPVLKSEERKIFSVQDQKAIFTPKEVKEMRNIDEPGVKILAFMRASDFDPFGWYIRPGYFLYPDEKKIAGSKDLFTTLLKRCSVLEKIAIVKYVLSRGRAPKLGVLIPSLPSGDQVSLFPQGFHLLPIPFSDEIRSHDLSFEMEASEGLVDSMKTVIKKLTQKKFSLLDIKNPSLQMFLRKIEEEALEITIEDSIDDYTEPNLELMKKRLEKLPETIECEVLSTGRMYSKSKSDVKKSTKKPLVDIEIEARHGRLKSCLNDQLRSYLESRGCHVDRYCNKATMIQEIEKLLEINQ